MYLFIFFNFQQIAYITQHNFPSFNLSMCTEEDGITINNEDRKEFLK